jgi:hypothetical protein
MKTLFLITGLSLSCISSNARDWYRMYLVSQINNYHIPTKSYGWCGTLPLNEGPKVYVPPWERPKGAIFCRMEDYLTTKTKVWFKVGVK